jgi:hypothetical protein
MVSGIMMAISASDPSPGTGYKQMAAATLSYIQPTIPTVNTGISAFDLSDDLVKDIAIKKGILDTVYVTKTDTVIEQITKVKWKEAPVPHPVVIKDTIRVPIYYLATQVGNKEGPTDECISVYEVHKVDEICPDTTNSSVKLVNEQDVDVGE